jgi:hypothetical protein
MSVEHNRRYGATFALLLLMVLGTLGLLTSVGLLLFGAKNASAPPDQVHDPKVEQTLREPTLLASLTGDAQTDQGDSVFENYAIRALEGAPPGYRANLLNNEVQPRGLVNLGNTCYFNSVTQCLAAVQHRLNVDSASSFGCFEPMRQYVLLLQQIRQGPGPAIDPGAVLDAFRHAVSGTSTTLFLRGHQECSMEALTMILQRTMERCRTFCSGTELSISVIKRMQCQQCGARKLKVDPSDQTLKLPISGGGLDEPLSIAQLQDMARDARPHWNFDDAIDLYARCKQTNWQIPISDPVYQRLQQGHCPVAPPLTAPLNLARLLNVYISAEDSLSEWAEHPRTHQVMLNTGVKCNACHGLDSLQQLVPQAWPAVLIISLKRCDQPTHKNTDVVELSEYLQVHPNRVYRFAAASIHGGNCRSGHYWAVVRYGDNYWNMNDALASRTTFEEVRSNASIYAVFYELISTAF